MISRKAVKFTVCLCHDIIKYFSQLYISLTAGYNFTSDYEMGDCYSRMKQSRETKKEKIQFDEIRKTLKKEEQLKQKQNRNRDTPENDTDIKDSEKRGNISKLSAKDKSKHQKQYQLSYWNPVGI